MTDVIAAWGLVALIWVGVVGFVALVALTAITFITAAVDELVCLRRSLRDG